MLQAAPYTHNSMKIAIISDSHNQITQLISAIEHAKLCGAETILHCGDITSHRALMHLIQFGLTLHVVHGNNPAEPGMLQSVAEAGAAHIHYHGAEARFSLAGRTIYMTHLPRPARLAAATGNFDLVCFGHSHSADIKPITNTSGGTTWLVNPGTVGAIDAPSTYAFGDLACLDFVIHHP